MPSPLKLQPQTEPTQFTITETPIEKQLREQGIDSFGTNAEAPASVQKAANTFIYSVGRILPYHLTRAKANAKAIRQAVR